MHPELLQVAKTLEKDGISVDLATLSKHHTQGFMSDVHTVSSSVGSLIIRICPITPYQEHLHTWEKISPLSVLIRSSTPIPVAEVFFSDRLESAIVIIQKKLSGSAAGKRVHRDDDFHDVWSATKERVQPQMVRLLAQLHQIPIHGYGWLCTDNSSLHGQFTTWQDFLTDELSLWLSNITIAERARGSDSDLVNKAKFLINYALPRLSYTGKPSIVHGDSTNLSNVLVDHDNITGIIDWELAIAADPAWEFAYPNDYPMGIYFESVRIFDPKAREDFMQRVSIYRDILGMLWLYIHACNPNSGLYNLARELFLRRMGTRQIV